MIGKTNGGSGGTGATLTITAPAGCTVTISRDGKAKTKTAGTDGLAVFKGLPTGTWTVTITDGSQTAQKTVTITADYATAITFFSAIIHITYPAGAVCTATDGVTTLTAPNTSGTWECVVPNAGTWTLSCKGVTKDIVIENDGQSANVNIAKLYLFKAGSGISADCTYGCGDFVEIVVNSSKITTKMADTVGSIESYLRTKSKIDLTPYSKMCMECIYKPLSGYVDNYSYDMGFGLSSYAFTHNNVTGHAYTVDALNIALKLPTLTTTKETFSLDVSANNGSYYVGFWGCADATIYNIWLEV